MKNRARNNILQRAVTSLREHGLCSTIMKLGGVIADHLFDFRFGIDTCGTRDLDRLTVNSRNRKRGRRYQPSRMILLKKLFRAIAPLIPSDGGLVDFGSGKGRVLLVASQFGFKELRGVEFASELCEIAVKNCAAFKAKTGVKSDFQIIESDAANYTVRKDDNIFFMFNPFDNTILRKVLNNIVRSLERWHRKILIIYYNPEYSDVIEQREHFAKLQQFNFWGNNFAVYSNCEPGFV